MSKRVQLICKDPSRTKQAFKAECDINLIMKRFKKVMDADYLSRFSSVVGGNFGDFSQITDYRSALEQLQVAEDSFMSLPAVVRKTFDNDPAMFLDFCNDPRNGDELVKMGLKNPPSKVVEKAAL